MTTSYPVAGSPVNPLAQVSSGAASLYRWLYRWHQETGDVSPSTRYLAQKQRKHERTVYRWLAELRGVNAVAHEVYEGIERCIIPLVEPLPKVTKQPAKRRVLGALKPAKPNGMSGVTAGVMSGVPPVYNALDALDASTKQVVDSLIAYGVTDSVAVYLAVRSLKECREQLAAIEFRQADDRAAVLVKSIREKWSAPGRLIKHKAKIQAEQTRLARVRAAEVLAQSSKNARESLQIALNGLSDADRAELRGLAISLYQKEQPAAARLMLGRRPGEAVIQDFMLRLLAEKKGGCIS